MYYNTQLTFYSQSEDFSDVKRAPDFESDFLPFNTFLD